MLSAKSTRLFCDLQKCGSRSEEITNNEDVLQEILVKLPIKVLLSFKCVSKQWLSIISSLQFGYLHFCSNPSTNVVYGLVLYQLPRPHHPEYDFIFLSGESNVNPFRSLTFVDGNSDIHRISSCKGLLCLCIVRYESVRSYEYHICNPTTNKSIKLPNLERPPVSGILSMTIAFDPHRSPFYKVVCVWSVGMLYRFSTYSSETKIWSDAGTSLEMRNSDYYLFRRGVFWNSSVHWVSKLGPFLRFDMDKECLEMMPATQIQKDRATRRIRYFGESHGHLHLIEIRKHEARFFDILEMKRDYSEWFVRYRVDFGRLYGILPENMAYPWKFYVLYIFHLENEKDIFRLVLSTAVSTYLFLVSDNSYILEKVGHLYHDVKGKIHYKWYYCHQHIMTLAAV
ncbi:hypothetical protein ACH5RR_000780 [Cinchona calisaya]|uniref:F-box domain-containing protein n=1 Tax=Cinchona calisaya TaxID=153742 RepID=A0ABD3B1R1_9GENT